MREDVSGTRDPLPFGQGQRRSEWRGTVIAAAVLVGVCTLLGIAFGLLA